jgi:hypothetical protein
MRSLTVSRKNPRYLAFLAFALLTSLLGCGDDGGETGNSAGDAGAPSGGGTTNGGTSNGGTGGGGVAPSARSCEQDCEDLADTLCAEEDFTVETCIPECEQAFQDAADSAGGKGCLEEFLVLDVCRADDPVCFHPDPNECVEENDAYIQCLEDAIE